GTLRIAVADPANLHGIDELRLATRQPLELGVASREDVLATIRKLVRTSEAFGARAAVAQEEEELRALEVEEGDVTDLEADDGVSDVPLVRLVNSILFQAAAAGASDIHFDPQEDAPAGRVRAAAAASRAGSRVGAAGDAFRGRPASNGCPARHRPGRLR